MEIKNVSYFFLRITYFILIDLNESTSVMDS